MPSIINRVKNHTKNSTLLSNYIFEDNKLSARAMGLYCYLIHLPEDQKISKTEIITHFKEGQKAMNTAFKELETFGYLSKEKTKQNGQFTGWKYTLYTFPNNFIKDFSN